MEWKLGRSDKIKRLALDTHTHTQVFLIQRKSYIMIESHSHAELG